ncbi:hypothetical protein D3C78_1487410 [compost metagenome]
MLALQDAQLDFGGLATHPGNVVEVLGLAGGEVGIAALQLKQAVARHIAFGRQHAGALQFLVEETDLRGTGAIDLLQALELHCRRRQVFLQDADLASETGAPCIEQALLQVHGGFQALVTLEALEQFGIEVHHVAVVTFRFQTVFHRLADDVLGADRPLFGSGTQ